MGIKPEMDTVDTEAADVEDIAGAKVTLDVDTGTSGYHNRVHTLPIPKPPQLKGR